MSAGVRASLAVLVAIAVACDCGDDEPEGAATGAATGPAATGRVAIGASQRPDAGAPAAQPDPAPTSAAPPTGPIRAEAFPAGTDERAFLAAAGALPAWAAVRERARLLGRQGNRGAAWGRLRRDGGGQLWLIDPVESSAVLGVRLAGAGGRELHADAGGRVVAWGAWNADAGRRWVWHVERMVALPFAQPVQAGALPAPPLPGHLVAELMQPPDGALPPSQLQKAGPVVFVVLAAPAKPGDGWIIADHAKGPPAAFLVLPGEAAIYGGLDYLSPEERWPLAPGAWYAVSAAGPSKPSRTRKPVAPGKPPGPGDLPVLRASEPPARVPPPGAPPSAKKLNKTGATVRER